MYQNLVYGGIEYDKFGMDIHGNVVNRDTNKVYKPSLAKTGYFVIYLPMGARGKVKCIRLHKAIAETFIHNPNNYPVVHHIDENKLNNSIDNLMWTTYKDNTNYHWGKISKTTEYYNNRKLNKEQIIKIKELNSEIGYRALAKIFNVSKTTIRNICKGYFYADV